MAKVVDKLAFFNKIGYQPHSEKQWGYHKSQARFRVASCGRRFGKMEWVENFIPLADGGGFKRMGDINIGDIILGPDGLPTKVLGVTDVMYGLDCFKVIFNDGNEVIVGGDHLWETWDKNARKTLGRSNHATDKRRRGKPEVRSTYELLSTLKTTGGESNHSIELCSPIKYSAKNYIIDPYTLGVWLSDGSKGTGSITKSDDDIDIFCRIESAGYSVDKLKSRQRWTVYGLHTQLKALGILNEKSVPEEYLYGSIEQRLALLQGLMDTDGTVSKSGNCCFDNTNKNIADAVYHLLVSLGAKATRYERIGKLNGADKKLCYRVNFSAPDFPVFSLPRKLERQLQKKKSTSQFFRFIVDVQPVNSVPARCIKVDREDGLYLTSKHFIITHNSTMAAKDAEPEMLVPKRRYWIVGPTYDLAEKEFREIWDDFIVKLQFGRHKGVKKAYNKRAGEMFIEFPWGTRVECRSAQHPEQLVGESLDGVIMSEAAKHNPETWERFIRPALSDKRGWATFPSTPEGHNWYYDLWLLGQNPELKDYQSWRFPSWDNPIVYPGGYQDPEIQLLKQTMSEERFMQEIGADFASFVGKIYLEFQVESHVDTVKFNPAWSNYITIDFGFVNPLAAVEFQVDPQDNIHIWREHYLANKTLEEHIAMMKAGAYTSSGGLPTPQPEGYHINLTFGDAADPEAILYINQHWAPCIGEPEAKTNWRQGIDLVKRFLRMRETGLVDEYGAPLEKPKLFIDYSCTNTIREFINYKAMEGKNGNNAKEVGRKMDDHAMDALRYGLVHLFELGVQHHLSEVYSSGSNSSGASSSTSSYDGENTTSSGSIFTEAAVSNF